MYRIIFIVFSREYYCSFSHDTFYFLLDKKEPINHERICSTLIRKPFDKALAIHVFHLPLFQSVFYSNYILLMCLFHVIKTIYT